MSERGFTQDFIDKLTYKHPAGSTLHHIEWDPSMSSFGVRVYPSGKKSFIITYRDTDHKKVFFALGQFPKLTLAEARKKAKVAFGKVSDGVSPLAEKRRASKGNRVADLCNAFMEKHAKVHKKSWKLDEQRINDYILPAWGSRGIESIKRRDVTDLHLSLKDKPYLANRVIELLSKMFELGKQWGYLEETAVNPARGCTPFKEEKRDRWVSREEMPNLARAIDEEPNFYASKALWLYLLTGLRKNELLRATWEDVDFERRELRVPDTKNGKTHYLPLSNEAISLLEQLPRVNGNPYVLPGDKPGHHLVNIDKPWRRVRKAAKVEDVRLHDLRRTVGSWLAQAGNSLHLIGRVLNHTSQATTAIYARFGQDSVAQAMDQHGKLLMESIKEPRSGNNVVPIEKNVSAK